MEHCLRSVSILLHSLLVLYCTFEVACMKGVRVILVCAYMSFLLLFFVHSKSDTEAEMLVNFNSWHITYKGMFELQNTYKYQMELNVVIVVSILRAHKWNQIT